MHEPIIYPVHFFGSTRVWDERLNWNGFRWLGVYFPTSPISCCEFDCGTSFCVLLLSFIDDKIVCKTDRILNTHRAAQQFKERPIVEVQERPGRRKTLKITIPLILRRHSPHFVSVACSHHKLAMAAAHTRAKMCRQERQWGTSLILSMHSIKSKAASTYIYMCIETWWYQRSRKMDNWTLAAGSDFSTLSRLLVQKGGWVYISDEIQILGAWGRRLIRSKTFWNAHLF